MNFFNRFLGGTIVPRVQLDFIPALAYAGHVLLRPVAPALDLATHVKAGVALQRLWLTSAALGLHLQPEMTPVIFRWYARSGRNFSDRSGDRGKGADVGEAIRRRGKCGGERRFFILLPNWQIPVPLARSTRKNLTDLAVS